MSNRVTSEAIQLHGGFGFTDEFPVSRLYRGARYGTLGGGTSETLRDLIGKRIMDATETGAELLAYDMMRAPDHGKDVRVARFSRKSPAKTAETHVLKRLSTETNFDPTER